MNKNRTTIFAIIAIAFLIYPLSVWGQTFSLSLDADTDLGDQKVLSVQVPADQIVPIQINGHGLRGATGISFRLEFDSQQVVFDDYSAGYTTYYGGSTSDTYSPTFIEIEMEPHDPIAVDSAMVVIVGFRTKANFSHTTIRLVWAEKWIEENKERVPINVGVELLLGQARPAPPSSDFNDDGRVDFPDFLLFVGKFGSRQGDETYQDEFDLDSDGAIGFSDFLIFSSAFGQSARHETFDIELVFINENDFTSKEKEIILSAGRRWESIIRGDLPDVDFSIYPQYEWVASLEATIYINDTIDDLRIFVEASSLIGVAGRGGPDALRDGTMLPIMGSIIIDKDKMVDEYSLFNVARHEIGHVLGIGTLWYDLIGNPSQNNPEADTYFRGPLARKAFNVAGGASYTAGEKVPVENGGDDAHWRESVFIDELMAPVYTLGYAEPLSAITVQALADLGYSVDVTQADAYQLPSQATKRPVSSKHEYEYCIPIRPRYIVDERGRVVRIINDAN